MSETKFSIKLVWSEQRTSFRKIHRARCRVTPLSGTALLDITVNHSHLLMRGRDIQSLVSSTLNSFKTSQPGYTELQCQGMINHAERDVAALK